MPQVDNDKLKKFQKDFRKALGEETPQDKQERLEKEAQDQKQTGKASETLLDKGMSAARKLFEDPEDDSEDKKKKKK
jgi:hypothetical protein